MELLPGGYFDSLLRLHTGLKNYRSAAPSCVDAVLWSPPALRPKWCVPGYVVAGQAQCQAPIWIRR
jgi:hypothetical protein